MTRGTTPTCRFELPFAVSELRDWVIVFAQRGVEKFRVGPEAGSAEGRLISVRLRQEDTLRLEGGVDADIQLKGLRADDGSVVVSRIRKEPVEPCLDGEVLA